MIEKVFLDSNVILDALLCREGKEAANSILSAGQSGQIRLCTSMLSFANIAYILRKYFRGEELRAMLKDIAGNIKVLPMGDQVVYDALDHWGPDFEDVLQYVCADCALCDCIITSDIRHYPDSALPVFTPQEFTFR